MKRLRTVMAFTAVLAMALSTVVFAAPSPAAGIVMVSVPGSGTTSVAQVSTPSTEEITQLAQYISENLASVGATGSIKTTIKIEAPAGYKGGDIPVVVAAAGLKNGATNVFAYILLPNGRKIIVPCVVKNGYVGFVAPAFGTVSIVEVNPSVRTATGATLH
ncbi:MAG: hypothetical protein K6E49_06750 [Lachnospiraceae bacterium]|nr:hypothetical protein [Lachnospiraceae bacterium]